MKTCSNCGSEVPPDKSICPNCGAIITQDAAWPPDPSDSDLETPVICNREGDLMRGFFTSGWLLVFAFLDLCLLRFSDLLLGTGIGVIMAVLSYFDIRKTRPIFARGLGFGLIAMVIAMLSFLTYVYSTWDGG